jgi:hypothetical protein
MFCVRFESSTVVSGHSRLSSDSFSSTSPRCSIRTISISTALRVSVTGRPSRSSA